jgi:hypothetical protein
MGYPNLKGNIMNKSWDVVGPQPIAHNEPISEIEESKMRSKVMLILAHKGGNSKVWKRVIKRFISCIGVKV